MDKKADISNNTQYTMAFEPNVLDTFDTPSYKFRFFMTKQSLFMKQEYGTRDDQITIAESGVTAIGIHSVRIEDAHGTLAENGATSTSLKIDFTLKEPFNASLYDLMYEASLELGIGNYLKCPYFLELVFTGNDATTSIPTNITDRKWIWPMFINKVDATVDASGTTHEFSCAHIRDFTMTDEFGVIQEPINVANNLTTLRSAIQFLGSEITNKQKHREHQVYENVWEINVSGPNADRLLESEIIPEEPDKNTSKHDSSQFTEGTSIQKILDMLLSSTKFMQEEAEKAKMSSGNSGGGSGADEADSRVFKKLYKIHTDMEYLQYDPGIGDYARRFIYEIVTYDTASLTVSPDEGKNTEKNSQESLDVTMRKGRMRKHYNYIYTGLNQQVEKFDFRFNMAWHASLPRVSGNTSQYNSKTTSGQLANDKKEQMYNTRAEWIESVRALERKKANAENHIGIENVSLADKSILELQNQLQTIEDKLNGFDSNGNKLINIPSESDRENLIREADRIAQIIDEKYTSVEQIQYEVDLGSKDESVKQLADALKNDEQVSKEIINKKFGDQFVEDLIFESATPSDGNTKKILTLTYTEMQTESDSTGGNPVKDEKRVLFSALFSQALKNPSGDLLSAEIIIKGDPFWLQPSDHISATKVKTTKELIEEQKNKEQPEGNAGLLLSENYLLFTAYLPDANRIFSGQPTSMGKNTLINGVYGVLKSTHAFENGKFTQTLECTRQFLCDLNHVQLEKYVLGQVNMDVANSTIGDIQLTAETESTQVADYLTTKMKTEADKALNKTDTLISNVSNDIIGSIDSGYNYLNNATDAIGNAGGDTILMNINNNTRNQVVQGNGIVDVLGDDDFLRQDVQNGQVNNSLGVKSWNNDVGI